MTERAISAPGKLFVSGEYAVLWGGVARVAAVAPRVAAYVRSRDDRRVDVLLESGRLTGTATPVGVKWAGEVSAEFRFVAQTIDLAYRLLSHDGPGFAVAFESSPTEAGRKLGFGSSARATVLAAEAARSALGATFDTLKLALVAHNDAQHGKGSGADVAACFAGGFSRYRRYPVERLVASARAGGFSSTLAQAQPVDLARLASPNASMMYAFSGSSASTTSLIAQVEREWSPEQRARFVETSDGLGDGLEKALLRGDFAGVTEACTELQALLWSLGATQNEGLERLLALATTFGCTGKQSGAGGGDGALLFAPDEGAREALLEALEQRKLFAMPVELDPGLQGEAVVPEALSWWVNSGW